MLDDWNKALARLERAYDDSQVSAREFLADNADPKPHDSSTTTTGEQTNG
jgi:hypothetical protein